MLLKINREKTIEQISWSVDDTRSFLALEQQLLVLTTSLHGKHHDHHDRRKEHAPYQNEARSVRFQEHFIGDACWERTHEHPIEIGEFRNERIARTFRRIVGEADRIAFFDIYIKSRELFFT